MADIRSGYMKSFDPRMFGADPTGRTDSTAALQATVDAMCPSSGIGGGVLDLRDGEWLISDTIVFTRHSVHVLGSGWGNSHVYGGAGQLPGFSSVVRWAAGAGQKPMFQFRDCMGVWVEKMRFHGANPLDHPEDVPTAAVNFHWQSGDNKGSNARLHVSDCYMGAYPWDSSNGATVGVGVLFDGGNGNNDEWTIERCIIKDATNAGVAVNGTQYVWNRLADTTITGCPVGIHSAADLHLTNPCFNRCDTDVVMEGPASLIVFGWNSERAKRFLQLGPNGRAHIWGGEMDTPDLTPGGNMFECYPSRDNQMLVIDGVDFDGGGATVISMAAEPTRVIDIPVRLVVRNCKNLTSANISVDLSSPTDQRIVEFNSGREAFRNVLSGGDDTLDTNRWDWT